jgi:hypothetical protein
LTIKNKKYNNQQAGLLALALGGPPVGVRLMGGGFARLAGSSVRWAGHRWGFVSWAGHHPLRQRGWWDKGRRGLRWGRWGGDDNIMGRSMGRGRGWGTTMDQRRTRRRSVQV